MNLSIYLNIIDVLEMHSTSKMKPRYEALRKKVPVFYFPLFCPILDCFHSISHIRRRGKALSVLVLKVFLSQEQNWGKSNCSAALNSRNSHRIPDTSGRPTEGEELETWPNIFPLGLIIY